VVIPDSARWSKPSTGGRKEDEAHNFDRILNSWYLIPEGTKFSQFGSNQASGSRSGIGIRIQNPDPDLGGQK
jgi:hypothetical protein